MEAVIAVARPDDELVVKSEELHRIDPLRRHLIGIQIVEHAVVVRPADLCRRPAVVRIVVRVAAEVEAAALHLAAREREVDAQAVLLVQHPFKRRVESARRAAIPIGQHIGAAAMMFPIRRREVAGEIIVGIVEERADAQERTVLPVLPKAGAGIPRLPVVAVAETLRVFPSAVCPVFHAGLFVTAAIGGVGAEGLPAAAMHGHLAVVLVVLRFGHDVDGAGRRRIALQHALGTAKDLDLADRGEIDLRKERGRHVGEIEALSIDHHEHAAKAVLAPARHRHLCQRGIARARPDDVERGCLPLKEIRDVLRAALRDLLARNDADRCRNLQGCAVGARRLDDDARQFGGGCFIGRLGKRAERPSRGNRHSECLLFHSS